MPQAIRIHETGGPEVLRFEEIPLADPGPGEALVRHAAIGINFIDTYHRSGFYALPALPSGLGMEAAGVVEAVGPGVSEVAVDDRVAYISGPPGAYAQARVHRADRLVKLPDEIDDETAAAMMLKGMTVEYLIRRMIGSPKRVIGPLAKYRRRAERVSSGEVEQARGERELLVDDLEVVWEERPHGWGQQPRCRGVWAR